MTISSQVPHLFSSSAVLPASVTCLSLAGKEIYLVGTAHVSKESVEDVKRTIETVRPDTVCIELCESRYKTLQNPDHWKNMDIVRIVKERKTLLLLSSLLMSAFQKRLGQQMGVAPGDEMKCAMGLAQKMNLNLVLADRDIQITLKRTFQSLGVWGKLKLLFHLIGSIFTDFKIDVETVETLKQKDQLEEILRVFTVGFPQLKEVLVDERDIFLAQKIKMAAGNKIVAIIGAGHVAGITREIRFDKILDPLLTVRVPRFFSSVLKWALPAGLLGLLSFSFLKSGPGYSLTSISIWVLSHSILSATGALLAFAHPLSILAAFIAAPLTSIHPLLAAGWVSGLVQAWIKKPTVRDLLLLPDEIVTIRGFWRNPATKILLVVAFSNLGSTLGTLIAGSWIALRLFQ